MGSFRRWATMMQRVHDTHTEGTTEETMGKALSPQVEAEEAPPRSSEKKRTHTPASDGSFRQI